MSLCCDIFLECFLLRGSRLFGIEESARLRTTKEGKSGVRRGCGMRLSDIIDDDYSCNENQSASLKT